VNGVRWRSNTREEHGTQEPFKRRGGEPGKKSQKPHTQDRRGGTQVCFPLIVRGNPHPKSFSRQLCRRPPEPPALLSQVGWYHPISSLFPFITEVVNKLLDTFSAT
jgi:hypothetical protein